ncbi:MAG: PTS transporter subunit EIIC [Bifidobacteriaceae bacterium]|jgi:PTS system beta-glucosides-specific IIC component|nr:PTS transporter subunit EIIC [Bifidobacteriaceae bacterium]
MDFKKAASEILEYTGGESNVKEAVNCMTRLRMEVVDLEKVDLSKLELIDGVITAQIRNGQVQVIIGPDVYEVLKEFPDSISQSIEGVTEISEDEVQESTSDSTGKFKPVDFAIRTFSGFFFPVILALGGAGTLKGILAICTSAGWVTPENPTYEVLNTLGDSVFYFLPMFLAVTAAERLRTNKFLALILAGALMYPTIINGAAQVAEGGPSALDIFGIPVPLLSYSSSVFPIILSVISLKFVYDFLDKFVPKALEYVVTSTVSVFVVGVVMFTVLAPLGNYIGIGLTEAFSWLYSVAGPIASMVLAGVFPILVMTGMAHALIPVMLNNIANLGYDFFLLPFMITCNINMGVAALAIALKTKKSKMRALGVSTGLTSILGISEPAMYGVTLRYRMSFVAVMIANAVVGFCCGIFGVKGYQLVGSSAFHFVTWIGPEGLTNLYFAIATIAIGAVVTFVLTWILTSKKALEEE